MSKSNTKPKTKRKSNTKQRMDWQNNDELISAKFSELLLRHQKIPSYEDIARALNMNVITIKRHVKKMDFKERFQKMRVLSDKVILNVFKNAATGKNHQFARMWLELFEELGTKKKI